MKILIPVDSDKVEVCQAFGRAPFFAVKDTEKDSLTYINNPAANAEGGAGIKAAQAVIDESASVLLTVRLGQNSADALKAAGIEIYKTDGPTVEENLEAYKNGKLSLLTKFHAGYHGIR